MRHTMSLRTRQELLASVRDRYAQANRREKGRILDELTAAIEVALDTVVDTGVTAAELVAAKRRLIAETIYAQDSIRALARMFGSALAIGDTVEEVQRWPSDLETVTVEEVNAVAQTYLDERRSVTGRLLSAASDGRS